MQIILDQNDIEVALENYVRSKISINEDQTVNIDLKAGRGDNGHSATIEIKEVDAKPAKKASKPKPAAKKPEPKPEPVKEEVKDVRV